MASPKLVYVDDDLPGITRRRSGRGWAYCDPQGARITDRDEIDRLNAVCIGKCALVLIALRSCAAYFSTSGLVSRSDWGRFLSEREMPVSTNAGQSSETPI